MCLNACLRMNSKSNIDNCVLNIIFIIQLSDRVFFPNIYVIILYMQVDVYYKIAQYYVSHKHSSITGFGCPKHHKDTDDDEESSSQMCISVMLASFQFILTEKK